MKGSFGWILVLLLVLAPVASARAAGAPPPAYASILQHYEVIRQALVGDTLDGVMKPAGEIEQLARSAAEETAVEGPPEYRELLVEIAAAAGELAEARDLGAARETFGELSKPLIRLRETAGFEKTVVVFCPMKKRSWLQPPGEIGNPYSGNEMSSCGTVLAGD